MLLNNRLFPISFLLAGLLLLGVAEVSPLHAKAKKTSDDAPRSIQDTVEAKSALLVDASTGTVLFERNATMRLHPASTTKLMTSLLVYEKTHMQGVVTVDDADTKVEPSHVPLKTGEQVAVADLMKAMLISSDNDAAMALSRFSSGSVGAFVEAMNRKAAELGCSNTYFTNPHGLPDSNEYTCSEDLLKIFNKVLEVSELREITATRYASLTTQIGTQRLKNHNKLLGAYPGMASAKTGWTYASRHTYAASCIRDGRELRLIILNSPNKWRDATALFNFGFSHLPEMKLQSPAPILASTTIPASVAQQVTQANNPTNTAKPAPVTISNAPKTVTNAATASTNAPGKGNSTNAETKSTTAQPPTPATNAAPTPSQPAATTNTNASPSRPVAQKVIPYVVKKGDSLTSIARRYHCGVEDVLLFNSIGDIDHLKVGQVIYVPIGLVKVQGQ